MKVVLWKLTGCLFALLIADMGVSAATNPPELPYMYIWLGLGASTLLMLFVAIVATFLEPDHG